MPHLIVPTGCLRPSRLGAPIHCRVHKRSVSGAVNVTAARSPLIHMRITSRCRRTVNDKVHITVGRRAAAELGR